MAIDFPGSPSTGQRHSHNNTTWEWDGSSWNRITIDLSTTDATTVVGLAVTQFARRDDDNIITGVTTFIGNGYTGVGNTVLIVEGDARVTGVLSVGQGSVSINERDIYAVGVVTGANFKTGTTNVHNVGVEAAGINVLGADTPIGAGATVYNSGLYVSKSGAEYQGVVTATTFKGAVEGNVTGNVSGSSGSSTGNAATATKLQTVRTIGGVNFDGSGNINLPGVNQAGNQNTTGTAALAEGLTGTPDIIVRNVTVTGIQTAEDVKNIDSVGIITARTGIDVTGGTFKADGLVGAAGSVLSTTGSGIHWVSPLTGPQGAQGRQGAVGAQGAAGVAGAQGHQGVQGTAGSSGGTGPQGVQGAQGHQGVQGAQGHQGHQGVQGAVGAQGAQGRQGATGAAGAQGAQGHQGVQGAAGAQGAQGVQGAANATTINNNANNRLITGSGTANTLEAESDLTWDGSSLAVNGDITTGSETNAELKINTTSSLSSYVERNDGVWGLWGPIVNFKKTQNGPSGTTFGQWGNHSEGHQIIFTKSRDNGSSGDSVKPGDDLGSIFWSPYNSANPGCSVQISVKADAGTWSSTSNPGYLAIKTTPDGDKNPTERMRFTSGGNIGIGTTVPTDTLHISKVANHGITLSRPAGGSNPGSASIKVYSHGALVATSANNITYTSGGSNNHIFNRGSDESLRITSAGKVGINEATPLARLHVKNGESSATGYAHDTIVVEDSDHAYLTFLTGTSGGAGINFGDSGSAQRGVIEYAHSSDYMRFITAQGERLRITSGGQVNIGGDYTQTSYATQITGDLLVQKTASAYLNPNIDIYNYVNGGYAGSITFSGKIGGSKYSQARIRAYGGSNTSDGALAIETGNMGEKLRITSDGKIGIGNNAPSWLLHLQQSSGTTTLGVKNTGGHSTVYVEASSGNTAKLNLFQAGTSGYSLQTGSTDALQIFRDSTYFAQFDSSGRFMIGTTTEGRATYGEHFTIAGSGHCGMTIRSGSSSYGILHFSDGTSGSDEYSGMVEYLQGTNRMRIFAGGKYNLVLNGGGSTEINHNENKKLETTSGGIEVTGGIDLTGEFNMTGNGAKYLDFFTLANSNSITFRHHNPSGNAFETAAYFVANGGAFLTHNGVTRLSTTSDGATVGGTGSITVPVGTTAQRPSASNGMIRANTTTNTIEGYIDGAWAELNNAPFTATGGTESTSGGYKYHSFTSSGTFTVSTGSGSIAILIVAGGGGGGGGQNYYHGGGGGAGGMREISTHNVTAQSYTITIGSGGGARSNGNNTTAFGYTSTGGGSGGSEHNDQRAGRSGGSGGGATYTGSAGSGTSGQGNNGGTGQSGGNWATGGGGGKSAVGGSAPNNTNAGSGGAGKSWLNSTTYAGGGGGCTSGGGNSGNGGSGGGGNGAINATNHGSANTGGGGGASDRSANGGNGGSGIVIIRYAV